MLRPSPALAALAAVTLASTAPAQLEHGGAPMPRERAERLRVPTHVLPAVDHAELLQEDLARPKGPLRFGVVQELDLGLAEGGAWHETPSGRIWLARVQSPGAFSLGLVFSEFSLTEGAELFVYDDRRETVRGAYTWSNNKPNGEFAIQPIAGDALTLEYHEPRGSAPGRLRLSGVVHDYRDFFALAGDDDAARGGACNVDVNCPQGAPWRGQIDSVVMTISGGLLCSASLINNTANDGRQLLISANHCGSMNNAVFRFGYQRPGCSTGSAPTNRTVQGSTLLAAGTSGDFRLMEILPAIPASYDAYYPGWDRTNAQFARAIAVHHPSGCEKKISFEDQAPVRSSIYWRIEDWDLGTTEPGSSGSPLYDQDGRFRGQLCCGLAACGNNLYDEYGALNTYWSQVAPFLDPLGTGATRLDGLDPSCPALAGSSLARNGSGANPAIYTALNAPVIGAAWQVAVDVASQGAGTSLVVVGLSDKHQGTFLSGTVRGEVLCQPPYLPADVAGGLHGLAIPFDCSLVGRTFCTQAATWVPGTVQLTNALDARIGSL